MQRQEIDRSRRAARILLLRRCALGIWLCGIALLGVVEFRRAAFAAGAPALTPIAWMWLAGSTVTGVVGVVLLVRELRRHRADANRSGP